MNRIQINIESMPISQVWKELFYSCMKNHKKKGTFMLNKDDFKFAVHVGLQFSCVSFNRKVKDSNINYVTKIIELKEGIFIEQFAWIQASTDQYKFRVDHIPFITTNYTDIYQMLKLMKQAYA